MLGIVLSELIDSEEDGIAARVLEGCSNKADVLEGSSTIVEVGGIALEESLLSVLKATGELDVGLPTTPVEVAEAKIVSSDVLVTMGPTQQGREVRVVTSSSDHGHSMTYC